jgi:TRAP-type C4-dicarboxylate transport system permease small subunit
MAGLVAKLERVVALLLAVIATLVVYQVVGRYVLERPPSWTEELARYLQVWLVLLASPICVWKSLHLAVDYLTPRLPHVAQRQVRSLIHLLVGLFGLLLAVFGARLLPVAAIQVSPALGISMVWPYLAVPTSGVLIALVAGTLLFEEQRGQRHRQLAEETPER